MVLGSFLILGTISTIGIPGTPFLSQGVTNDPDARQRADAVLLDRYSPRGEVLWGVVSGAQVFSLSGGYTRYQTADDFQKAGVPGA